MSAAIREQAVVVGGSNPMVGIVTPTRLQASEGTQPWVVILNAGIVHRVGPNRIHVMLARALAAEGYPSLRFDLHGIGDSDKPPNALPLLEANLADVREVLNWLEATRSVRQVILVGLCSGADHSALYAGSDPRVAGIVLLDPSIPRTAGYYFRYYGTRLSRIRSWLTLGSDLTSRISDAVRFGARRSSSSNPASGAPPIDSVEVREYLKKAYQKALDEGVEVLAVFTGNRDNRHNYREQMLDAFKGVAFGNKLQLEFLRQSDHTFTSEHQRQILIDLVVDWARTRRLNRSAAGASGR
jgi:pimeloyl-ACP methyl ester carboxylesterase